MGPYRGLEAGMELFDKNTNLLKNIKGKTDATCPTVSGEIPGVAWQRTA